MDFTDFPTGADDEGRRLDKVIRIFIPDLKHLSVNAKRPYKGK